MSANAVEHLDQKADNDEQNSSIGLEQLPPDELARIMTFLKLSDVQNLSLCSKKLRANCSDERIWYSMCEGITTETDIRQWMDREGGSTPGSRTDGRTLPLKTSPSPRHSVSVPTTFKNLYAYLKHVGKLCGLWRVIGEGPVGALVSFNWTQDGIQGQEIKYVTFAMLPDKTDYHTISPRKGLTTEVEWNDYDNTVTLKIYPVRYASNSMRRSTSAEMAASVSLGNPGVASHTVNLGSSPEGSFEYAWLEYMSSNVASSSKKLKRRSSRGGGTPVSGQPGPELYHLRRVEQPIPSVRHPLAGLWLGDYGLAGLQIIKINYDFTGRAARLIAEKITGDERVAAGQKTWWAHAAPLKEPLDTEESQLVSSLQQLQLEEREDNALRGLEALFLEVEEEEEEEESLFGAVHHSDVLNGSHTHGGNNNNNTMIGQHVVGVHVGAGHVGIAAGQPREWVEGRLWVLSDGCLRMWWLESIMQSVLLRRIDSELKFRKEFDRL